jgi:hypothetical protein
VGLDNGELVYITLPEVEAYVAEYVKRYTSPLAVTFGYEEDLSYGLGRTNSIIRSMSNIAYQSKPRATRSDERASLQLARENAKIYERNQEIIDQDSQPVELIIGDQQVD